MQFNNTTTWGSIEWATSGAQAPWEAAASTLSCKPSLSAAMRGAEAEFSHGDHPERLKRDAQALNAFSGAKRKPR
jgi:hypothetical protein